MNFDLVHRMQKNRKIVLTLVIGMLLAQWLAITHVHKQGDKTRDSLCSICLAGKHFHSALASNAAVLLSNPIKYFIIAVLTHQVFQPIFSAFHSRAPPTRH